MLEKTAERQKLQRGAQKRPCAGMIYKSERCRSDRMERDCKKRTLPKAAVRKDCEKLIVLISGHGNRLLAVDDDAEGVVVMGRTTLLLKGGSANISLTGKGPLVCG